MIQVHPTLRKSLVECTLSSREISFLSSIIYTQNGQVTIKVSLFFYTALQQFAWFQCTTTIYSRKNNIYKQQILLQGHANKRN